MGKKKESVIRVVLDTNVLVSALLFEGTVSKFAVLWKSGSILPSISRETFQELRTVLQYPKFRLSEEEIKMIIETEILPYFEVVEITGKEKIDCRDPDDEKFIHCAIAGKAQFLITGDKDLLTFSSPKSLRILNPSQFFNFLNR